MAIQKKASKRRQVKEPNNKPSKQAKVKNPKIKNADQEAFDMFRGQRLYFESKEIASMSNEEQSGAKFFMLWHGQGILISVFYHHYMGTLLAGYNPTISLKLFNNLNS